MQNVTRVILFLGITYVGERMLERGEGKLESVRACLIKKRGGGEIRHMQKNPVTMSADDLWGWKYFDNNSEGTRKESL